MNPLNLTTDEFDQLTAYRRVYDSLFSGPLGIPTVDVLQEKAEKGTLTVSDSIASRFYIQGIVKDDMSSFANFPEEDIAKIKKLYAAFPDATKGGGEAVRTIEGYEKIVKNFQSLFDNSKFDNSQFNTLISDIERNAAKLKRDEVPNIGWLESNHIKPFRKVDGIREKLLAGDILVERKGTGSRILGEIPGKQVVNIILNGISKIEDNSLRRAAVAALFGQRGEALLNMKKNEDAATKFKGKIRPWYDIKEGIIHNPTDTKSIIEIGGRKRLPPTVKVGPLLRHILDQQFVASGSSDDLFPNLRPKDLTKVLNKFVHKTGGISNYSESLLKKLGRSPSGYTDLRRVFVSVAINEIANQTDDPAKKKELIKLADQMLGHNVKKAMSLDKLDDLNLQVMESHYAKLKGKGVDIADNKLPILMEQFLAEAMNAVDEKGQLRSNRLAAMLNINVPDNLGHIYSNTIEGEVINKVPNKNELAATEDIKVETKQNIASSNVKSQQTQILENVQENINIAKDIETGATTLEEKGWTVDRETGKAVPPESEIKLNKKQQAFYDKFFGRAKKLKTEIVGDISQTWDEGVERITSKQTYKDIAEAALDPEEWQRTASKLAPLAGLVGGRFVKAGKYVKGAGKLLIPGSKTEGKAEIQLLAQEEIMRDEWERREREKAALAMADTETQSIEQAENIGDKKFETTEDRISRQMLDVGFGS